MNLSPKIEIRLMQRSDHSRYLELRIPSNIRHGLIKLGILEANQPTSTLRKRIQALAGAMAEELCEQYSDTLDPSLVAREATELFDEFVQDNPLIFPGDEPRRTVGKWAH